MLGVKGVCFITHGSSNANAIKNAIRVAAEFAEHPINAEIERTLTGIRAARAARRIPSTARHSRHRFEQHDLFALTKADIEFVKNVEPAQQIEAVSFQGKTRMARLRPSLRAPGPP